MKNVGKNENKLKINTAFDEEEAKFTESKISPIEKETSPSVLNTENPLEPDSKGDIIKVPAEEKPIDVELLELEQKLGKSNITRLHYM